MSARKKTTGTRKTKAAGKSRATKKKVPGKKRVTSRRASAARPDRPNSVAAASMLLATGDERPRGVLSLTYHLVHDSITNGRWSNAHAYRQLLDDFGIHGTERDLLIDLNAKINRDRRGKDRELLVNAWLAIVKTQLLDVYKRLW